MTNFLKNVFQNAKKLLTQNKFMIKFKMFFQKKIKKKNMKKNTKK